MMTSSTTLPLAALPKHASEAVTDGIRIRVEPSFLSSKSKPAAGRWVFGYRVVVTNESEGIVRLLSRKWSIVDADGDANAVSGEGVVGQQPLLRVGESFEYSSFAPLETSWGTMEGSFVFARSDDSLFEARIARFYLVSE